MKKYLFFAAACVAIASCSKGTDDVQEFPVEDKLPINIATTITHTATRATDTAFENGDKVGIYVVNQPDELLASGNHADNVAFTYSGSWSGATQLYWKDQTTKADFYCYYPYGTPSSVSAHTFATKADQSLLADYKASDFMWGKNTGVTPTATAVPITVKHLFSNALIYVKAGDGFTDEALAAADVQVQINNVKTTAAIDLATGAATATGTATSVVPYNEGSYYRALIVPQTVEEGALIVITIDGVSYTLTRGFTFAANKQYKFTVTVRKMNNGVNIGIGSWETVEEDYGGSAE